MKPTLINLYPTPESTFSTEMTVAQMRVLVSLSQFRDFWGGVPPGVRDGLTRAAKKISEKGKYAEATVGSTGTTLADAWPFLSPPLKSQIDIILACNYYGLFDCRP